MHEPSTLVGSKFYKPDNPADTTRREQRFSAGVKTILLQRDPDAIFRPMQLERTMLLVLLPLFALACFAAATADMLMGTDTWFERYQLIPSGLIFLGLFVWGWRTRAPGIYRVRWATLIVGPGIVMERFALGLWWTYSHGGHDHHWIMGVGPWVTLAACLYVFLIPNRRALAAGLAYYCVAVALIAFFTLLNPHELPPGVHQELYVTIVVATPIFLVLTAGFTRLRMAYGTALNKAEEFENQAMQDGLTGLFNRRALVNSLVRARARQQRKGTPVSFILADIDHFKWINDLYGHSKGDEALVRVVHLLTSTLRRTDEAFRWGGEEFLIVLEETDVRGACEVAERLRKLVESSKVIKDRKVTLSFGVTGMKPGEDDITVFNRLDEALYEAKETGRNRVVRRRLPKDPSDPKIVALAELVDDTSWAFS